MEIALFIGIGVVLGIILTVGTFYIWDKYFDNSEKILSVDGIFSPSLTMGSGSDKESFNAQIEFHILSRTEKLFKIKILRITCDSTRYMDAETIEKIRLLYDNLWIDKDRLEFVVDLDTQERLETIKNIINS